MSRAQELRASLIHRSNAVSYTDLRGVCLSIEELDVVITAAAQQEQERMWKAVNKPEGTHCKARTWFCPFYNYGSFFIQCELFGADLVGDGKCEKCRGMNYDDVPAAPVLAPTKEKP